MPFASSSSGNCTLVETPFAKLIIDIGISLKALNACLKSIEFSFDDIDAVFITHLHQDHIKGLAQLLKTTTIPIYTHAKNVQLLITQFNFHIYANRIHPLCKTWTLRDLQIQIFELPHQGWIINNHDTTGQHTGFLFEHCDSETCLAYATDLGHLPESIQKLIEKSDAYFFEANYDDELQLHSGRPMGLIKRNIGNFGHLSNHQAGEYLANLACTHRTKKIVLAHLSHQCNNADLATTTVQNYLQKKMLSHIPVHVAHQRRFIVAN